MKLNLPKKAHSTRLKCSSHMNEEVYANDNPNGIPNTFYSLIPCHGDKFIALSLAKKQT